MQGHVVSMKEGRRVNRADAFKARRCVIGLCLRRSRWCIGQIRTLVSAGMDLRVGLLGLYQQNVIRGVAITFQPNDREITLFWFEA